MRLLTRHGPERPTNVGQGIGGRHHRRCSVRASLNRISRPTAAALRREDNDGDAPSTSDSTLDHLSLPLGRRHVSLGAAVFITAMASGDAAEAAKTITLRDGSRVEAFEHGMSLAIVALRGSVPGHWPLEFKTSIGTYCGFSLDQRPQIADIFKELSDISGTNKRSAGVADVATLGDTWLAPAVQGGLIQPIPGAESYRWYRLLPPRLRQLVRRNKQGLPDPHGAMYGVPYRWGCTLIAYRRDRLFRRGGRPVLDWSDLLQPALAGRVALLDDPRELLAAALRSLGLSPNAGLAEMEAAGVSEQALRDRVAAFRRQVRLFSSRDHVRALHAGDVWAVVGYSQDLVLSAERSGQLELVAPLSGTQLWADVWVVPAGARGGHRRSGPSPLLPVWFEFTLSPGRIAGNPSLKTGAPAALLPSATSPASPDSPAHDLRAHRRHLRDLHAAKAEAHRGPLAAPVHTLTGLARELPLLRPFLNDPRVAHRRVEDEEEDVVNSVDSGAGGMGEAEGDATQPLSTSASQMSSYYPAVELHGDNGYLPPTAIVNRSEFLLPVDEATLGMYRRVLEG